MPKVAPDKFDPLEGLAQYTRALQARQLPRSGLVQQLNTTMRPHIPVQHIVI